MALFVFFSYFSSCAGKGALIIVPPALFVKRWPRLVRSVRLILTPPDYAEPGNPGPLALRPFTTLSPSGAGDLHANESSADTPVSQERGLYTTLSPVMPGTIEFSPLTAMENSGLYGRMDRLQALFHDLQREVAATGGKGGDNARAAELRGRIAEIMRVESTAGSTSGGDGSMRGSMSEIETHPPPAYEQA